MLMPVFLFVLSVLSRNLLLCNIGSNASSELLHMVFITLWLTQSIAVGESPGDWACKSLRNTLCEKAKFSQFYILDEWNQNVYAIVSVDSIFLWIVNVRKTESHCFICNGMKNLKGTGYF